MTNKSQPTSGELVDVLFQKAGGCKWFSVLAYMATSTGINSISFFFYQIPFLVQKQVYSCEFSIPDQNMQEVCTVENICSDDPRISSWEIDYSDDRSLNNWQQQLGLMCEPDYKGALLGSISLFAMLATLPFLPPLADKYGRKWVFVVGRFIECILFTILMSTSSWTLMMAVMAGFGMTTTTRMTVGITYMQELFPTHRQVLILVMFWVEGSLIYMLCTIYFWKISKDWFNFVLIGYILCILTTGLSLIVPESPRLLLAQGRIEEFKKALDFVAKVNFRPKFDWSKIDLTSAKYEMR